MDKTALQKEFVERFCFEDPRSEELAQFRKAYGLDALARSGSEMDKLLRLAEWAYAQFYMFGRPTLQTENALEILQASAAGHTFYCAHYAIVYCAAATALGWTARPISVRRAEESYHLSNHNIVEVWATELKRWVCFEPTYGGCVAIAGQPVSAYEAARQWFTHQGEGLQVLLGPRRQVVTK
ncbi:MAG: transglutaminase domain-containing protein, partial [Planctomycetota bacterium]